MKGSKVVFPTYLQRFLNRKIHGESSLCILGENLLIVGSKLRAHTTSLYNLKSDITRGVSGESCLGA